MNNYGYPYLGQVERKSKLFNNRERFLLLVLLLASMHFYLYGLHIMIVAFVFTCVLSGRIHYVDGLFAPALLSVALLFFWKNSLDGPSTITKWMVWPMAFLMGYEMTGMETLDMEGAEKLEKKVRWYMLIVALGFFIHFALNFYINRGASDLGRNTMDYWSKDIKAATGQAAQAGIPLGWCVASFINNNSFIKKIPAVIGLGVILLYNLVLSTRTIFLMVLLVTLVAIIYLVSTADKAQKKTYTVLTVVVVLILAAIAYQMNLFNLQAHIEESEFYSRFFKKGSQDISEDTRFDNKLKHLQYLPLALWGGDRIRPVVGGYAHDLFLDLHNDAGILAFIASIMMVCGSMGILRRLLRNKNVRFETKMTMLCVFTAIYMEFMVEPIFAGAPEVLMMFCFLYGMINRMDRNLTQLQLAEAETSEKDE